jgi:hypothetical protein
MKYLIIIQVLLPVLLSAQLAPFPDFFFDNTQDRWQIHRVQGQKQASLLTAMVIAEGNDQYSEWVFDHLNNNAGITSNSISWMQTRLYNNESFRGTGTGLKVVQIRENKDEFTSTVAMLNTRLVFRPHASIWLLGASAVALNQSPMREHALGLVWFCGPGWKMEAAVRQRNKDGVNTWAWDYRSGINYRNHNGIEFSIRYAPHTLQTGIVIRHSSKRITLRAGYQMEQNNCGTDHQLVLRISGRSFSRISFFN